MKKSSIWKLLFSALTVFAVAVFAGCTDDNDDMGAPYLNVTPENLTFDAEGQPADEYNGTFIVETNRPWRAIVEDEQTWVRLSATEGEGDAAVTVTVPASNIGQSAKVTFEVYNSYGALIQKDVNVLQGEVVPPDPGEATAITIPELIAQMTDTEAPVDANADRYLDAVVMNDVAGANYTFNKLILATENATEAGNGITLYGSQVEPSTLGLNKGDKVRVTLYKGLAKVKNYNGMYEVTGDREATWCKVEKTGTVTSIPTATIAAADLAKYQGMAVTIANASVAQAGVWASASALSSHTFTADGANFTVFCKQSDEKNPSVFLDVPFKAGSGNISGLAAVYMNNSQLVPRNLDDVAAFSDSSTPMITGVTPASLSFEAAGGEKTLTVSVINQGDNQLSVSGLTAPLSATVSGLTVTVKADPNTGTQPVNQTLTITLANGNSKTVPVVLAGQGGSEGGDATIITVDFGESAQGLPTSKADGAGPSEKTYTFSGYEFIINVAAGANVYWLDGSKWNTTPPNKAMYFNGDDTYIQFPVVAGKKLTKVEFSSPYGAGAGVGIVIKDTSDAIVAGGEMQTINANETITFNLTGTTADTAYRMARTAKNAQCTKLVLSYE